MKPFALIVAQAFLPVWLMAASPEYEQAHKLYNSTDFQQSLKVLLAIPAKDGSAYALIGRNYYMQGEFKKATEVLERAIALEPSNAESALWLARAYGRRAETSSVFTAPGYASRARQFFEKSVALNPGNLDAQADLFEYYLEAPGFLGGGFDKAEAAAAQIAKINPAEGHWALAKLAERRKEFGRAEEHLARAIELAPQQVGRVLEMARFLFRQGRFQEADQNLARAEKVAPNSPKVLFTKAELYIKAHHNVDVAKEILKRYMSMNLTPEDPPKSEAAKLLRQVQGG